jgi:pimeloyl-ACP methyl ester carboxylesterase
MATFVLVHGMFAGGWIWKKVTPLLRAGGHEVYAVTLTGLGERAHLRSPDIDMNTHIQDVVGVLEYEDLNKVILVGHSLSGFMVPAVAERIPERIGHIVNLDGKIPADDKSFKEFMPDRWEELRKQARASGDEWWIPPSAEWMRGTALEWIIPKLTPHPLKTWDTPNLFGNPAAHTIPRTFIQCIEGLSSEDITAQQQECARTGWQYRQLSTEHEAMILAPHALSELLLEFM